RVTQRFDNLDKGEIGLVQQDAETRTLTVAKDTNGTEVSFAGKDAEGNAIDRKLTHVAPGTVGASSVDAINGGQLHATAQSTASALGGGATVDADGKITAPTYTVGEFTANNVGDVITHVDSRFTGIDGRVTGIDGQVTDIDSRVTDIGGRVSGIDDRVTQRFDNLDKGEIGLVQQDAETRTLTVAKDTDGTEVSFAGKDAEGNAIDRKLTHVAPGTVGASSVDAINGAQLYATAQSTASALGGGATVDADGKITAPAYAVAGATVNNVGDALTHVDKRVTSIDDRVTEQYGNINQQIANGNIGHRFIRINSTRDDARDANAVEQNDIAIGDGAYANAKLKDRASAAVAIGAESNAVGGRAVAFGPGASASAENTTSLGTNAEASRTGAVSIGTWSSATATDAVALGAASVADRGPLIRMTNPLAYGSGNDITTLKGAVSVGSITGQRQIINVAPGSMDTDAVNVSQVRNVKTVVDSNAAATAAALGGGSSVGADGKITAPAYAVGDLSVDNVGLALSHVDERVASIDGRLTSQLGTLTDQIGTIGLVQQDVQTRMLTVAKDTDGTEVSFAGKNAGGDVIDRKLTHIAAGAVSASSADAINGAQLYATARGAADALGGGATVGADGKITAPVYNVGESIVNNVGEAITHVDNRVTSIDGRLTGQLGSLTEQIGTIGLVQQDVQTRTLTVAKDTDGTEVSFAGKGVGVNMIDRKLTHVAPGIVSATSVDAINGSQLYTMTTNIANALGGGAFVGSNGVLNGPTYALSGQSFNNVGGALVYLDERVGKLETADAGGEASVAPKPEPTRMAIKLRRYVDIPQDKQTMQAAQAAPVAQSAPAAQSTGATVWGDNAVASGSNAAALGTNAVASANNSVALGANSVADRENSVSVGSADQQRIITNVMAGTQDTDAVNVGQLNNATAQVNHVKESVDNLQRQVNHRFDQMSDRMHRIGAMSAAMSNMLASVAGIQTPNSVAVGVGTYRGQTALAVGYQRKVAGRWAITIGGSATGGSDFNIGAGAGYGW
ncbi:YadA-like family protein, partial [Pandoraea sp. NPDC087047]|uniref:YadA family autotransporter adhesin n=1 Tax=Pandoraea sp. NPDC087047 TaxID=3364390 RepID=UPI0037F7C4C4